MNTLQVSKRWNSIARDFKIKELIFHKYYYDQISNKWATGELYDQKMAISDLYVSKPLTLNTTFIQRLVIYLDENQNFQLINLNKLQHLQHLELRNIEQQGITFLNLPNLKILKCSIVHNCNLVFNTPALTAVYMFASEKVRFRNLPMLKLYKFDGELSYFRSFNRIKNVELFRMRYNRNFHIICFILANLNLKEVRWDYSLLANAIDREYFEEWVARILKKRRNLNKSDVKIYIFDILLEDDKAFEEYEFENVDRLHIY